MISKKTVAALVLVGVQLAVLVFVVGKDKKKSAATSALPPITASKVYKLTLQKGTDGVELVREDGAAAAGATGVDGGLPPPEALWKLTKPSAYAADKALVKTLLERLEKMSAAGEPISKKTEWHDEKFGVGDKTGTRIELWSQDGGLLASMILGKTEGGRTFLRKPGEDAVYGATGIVAYAFDKKPAEWRDKTIFDLKEEDLTTLAVRGAEPALLARDAADPKKWTFAEPAGWKLDQGKAQSLGRAFAQLKAKEFGEGTETDALTGFSKPEAAVVATTRDGKQHTLIVGRKKGQDSYVKRGDLPTLFVLGTFQVEQLVKKATELKEKEPIIPKPEPKDVQSVTLRSAAGAVTLTRTGDAWELSGAAQGPADAGAVQRLLGEVQRLNVPEATHGGQEKHAAYEVDAKGLRVELRGAGGAVLSAFILGKEDKGQTALRKAGDAKIYKTYGLQRAAFDKPALAWKAGAPGAAPGAPGAAAGKPSGLGAPGASAPAAPTSPKAPLAPAPKPSK